MEQQVSRELDLIPEEKDPRVFVRRFMESKLFKQGCCGDDGSNISGFDGYKKAIEDRRSKMIGSVGEDLTNDEILDVFLDTDQAKVLMILFGRDVLHLKYDEQQYPKNVAGVIEEYRAFLRMIGSDRKKLELDALPVDMRRTEMKDLDNGRQFRHERAAKSLESAGIAPSQRLGRVMVRLLMVSTGDDTFDILQNDETKRYERLAKIVSSEQGVTYN